MHSPIPAQSRNSPLLLVWARFIHVSLRLEACQEPLLVRALFAPAITPRPLQPRDVTCPPASAWFVPEPHTVLAEVPALIPLVTARAPDLTTVPTHQHESFQCAYVLTHTLPENFPGGHPSQNCSKLSTLNFGVSKL